MTLISTTDALKAFCEPLHGEDFVTIDTEFMREKTYWPVLCLVQIGGAKEAVAVDAMADGMDLAPLIDLLADPNVMKVFHAGRQDMEIFCRLMDGALPHPVFDTQVAAMVCGFGESVSYENLVKRLAKAQIDKGSRFTDWSLRPLTDKQLAYALADVTHLRIAYEKLRDQLKANGRASWVDAEMAVITDPATYVTHPEDAYKRIKLRGAKPRVLAVLREVAAWREKEAQRADVPRGRILRDEALTEIAHHAPETPEKLARVRGLSPKMANGWQGEKLITAVKKAKALDPKDHPVLKTEAPLPRGAGPAADLIRVLLKLRAEESGVAQRLIASSAEVERLAVLGDAADVPALKGWRRELFGEEALKLMNGDLALAADGDGVRVIEKPA